MSLVRRQVGRRRRHILGPAPKAKRVGLFQLDDLPRFPQPTQMLAVHVRLDVRGTDAIDPDPFVSVVQGYISALEAGTKANPGLDVLTKLAKALGVPVTELLG